MVWKRQDIRQLMLQDRAKGKHPRPDPESVRERRELLRDMGNVLEIRDEATFLRVLITDYELQVGSEGYRSALKIWKDYQQRNRGFSS